VGLKAADPETRVNLGERALFALFGRWLEGQGGGGEGSGGPPEEGLPSFCIEQPSSVSITVVQAGVPLMRCMLDELPSKPPQQLPHWLLQCVMHGQFTPKASPKLSFALAPHESSRLPQLSASACRLSAPRALKLGRIAAHVERSLAAEDEMQVRVSLRCSGKPLPSSMSILTARTHLWKQGGEMVLTYEEEEDRSCSGGSSPSPEA
jgi:hypothetical protein